jgi:L-ascorbate metabolism protein UlaG (beta-lactamase superfamily)
VSDQIATSLGSLTVHPVHHASLALTVGDAVIFSDPVGDPSRYAGLPKPTLILVTHEHGDHFSNETLEALPGEAPLVVNPGVFEALSPALTSRATRLANGESTHATGIPVAALPAYNITPERRKYHPRGPYNGYVLTLGNARVYIAGDTEDTPEMRGLSGISLAFLPMNLPYTMTVEQAASAVSDFRPVVVYPFHYKGSDLNAFKSLVESGKSGTEVRIRDWYPEP